MRALSPWVRACGACGFQASNLVPREGTGIPGLEALRRENFEVILDRLAQRINVEGARILEVGCARGWFLEAANRRGARAQGIEPEASNARQARASGLVVETGYFPRDLEDRRPYDAVVFNDVFEHLEKPSAVIADVQSLLKPGGMAVFNYPSSRGALFRIASLLSSVGIRGPLERLWQVGMPSPHVSYFDPHNLDVLVRRHTRLQPVDRFPLRSVSRNGLAARIGASHAGAARAVIVSAVWTLSFVLPLLPSDIEVSFFRRPG